MKKQKYLFISLITMSILFLVLYGCAKSDKSGLNVADTNADSNTDDIYHSWNSSFLIDDIGEESNFKDVILRHIKDSRTATRENENYSAYRQTKLSDMQEFYYPSLTIEGYKINQVNIYDDTYFFYYVPVDESKRMQEEYMFDSPDKGLIIGISKTEYADPSDPLKFFRDDLDKGNTSYIAEDNWIYLEFNKLIMMQIDSTWLMIRMPDKLNDYEYLRGLCKELLETTELINVDKALQGDLIN